MFGRIRWSFWLSIISFSAWMIQGSNGFLTNLLQKWKASESSVTCNTNTSFTCPCETCWTDISPFFSSSEPQWVAVEFQKCPVMTEAAELSSRTKLAQWLTEECAFVLDCHFAVEPFTAANILIGGYECSEDVIQHGIIYFTALKNSSGGFTADNIVPPSALGSVVQAREHLFSSIFRSDLDSVMIIEKPQSQPPKPKVSLRSPLWIAVIGFLSLILSFILTFSIICLCTICCFSQIQWSRFASTKWIKGTHEPKPKQRPLHDNNNNGHELTLLRKATTSNDEKGECKIIMKDEEVQLSDQSK